MTVINIDRLRQLTAEANSLSALLRLLGGGCRDRIKRLLEKHQISILHWIPKGRRPIEDYLSNRYPLATHSLKKRLFREGLKRPVCEHCLSESWQGEPLPIEMHHVDGNRHNNALDNLQILCRNCHGLAPNHKGAAAKRKRATKVARKTYIETIPECINPSDVCRRLGLTPKGRNYDTIYGIMAKEGLAFKIVQETEQPRDLEGLHVIQEKLPKATSQEGKARRRVYDLKRNLFGTRKDAAMARRKVTWPNTEELQHLVWEKPIEHLAKDYGVSGNSVRHWAKLQQVALPPSGYWLRRNFGFSHDEALVSQKRVRPTLRRPTEEQAKRAYQLIEDGSSWRSAGLDIGFDHETTKSALARFNLIPDGYCIDVTRHNTPTLKKMAEDNVVET